jgi:hypothetical protein
MDILERIEFEKKEKLRKIEEESQRKCGQLRSSLSAKLEKKYREQNDSLLQDAAAQISLRKKEIEFDLANQDEEFKVQAIQTLSERLFSWFQALKGEKLLDLVASLLNKEDLSGFKELVLSVNAADYAKFAPALSSAAKGSRISCDLLESRLRQKKKAYLLSEPANIGSGFLLISEFYDLSFDFSDLIANYNETLEQILKEKLFGTKS